MQKIKSILLNLIFFIQVLLIFLLLFDDRIELPVWLQVAGRLHPALLHLPIGLLVFLIFLLLARNEFKKKAFNKIMLIVLLLTSFTATVTALFGFFLSRQGDYGPDALTQHKISGTLLSLLCYGLVLTFIRKEKNSTLFYGLGLLTVGFMFFAGHTGGTLTHGENYVFAPLSNSPNNAVADADASVFQMAVFPILEKKCFTCHNEKKAKGKFVMTSVAKFKKGGKHGKEWEEGKPENSRMIKYIHLPLEDDDHMPPDGKPQLSTQEMKMLESWIRAGADFEKKLTDLMDNDSLKIIATAVAASKNNHIEEKQYGFTAAPEEVVRKLNTPFRSVFPLYQKSPALQADFFIKESFESGALEELKEVRDQLVVLNLSKMPVIDKDLLVIGSFKNLEKINLNFSKINGAGLSSLQGLKNLNSLSLAGTDITSESLKPVMVLPALKELFVWNTVITEEQRAKLEAQHPGITIRTSQFKEDKTLRLSRPLMMNEGVVKKGEPVVIKHSMPGVTIRYTLDGNNPDSVVSKMYDAPLKLLVSTKIKAIACKSGWYCSEVFETTCFVEGQRPVHVELLTAPDKQYPGEGAKSLTDGRKGFTDVFKEPSWLGYRDQPLAAGFDFGPNPSGIHTIMISYGRSIGSYIFPPMVVEVWGGRNRNDLRLIKSLKVEQPVKDEPQRIEALSIPLEKVNHSYYKLIVKPVDKLPKWHSGKGKKGWVMVDEVFFY